MSATTEVFPARQRIRTIPVLTYHSHRVQRNTYRGNDHIAFEEDLCTIDRLGFRVIPLDTVVDWYEGLIPDSEVERSVALTLDDGSRLDYHNVHHPTCGDQFGMLKLLEKFEKSNSNANQTSLHVSSFVIASPSARSELDQKGLVGKDWWGDDWWKPAHASGLMNIECHSWDHNHPSLGKVAQKDNIKGDFKAIDSLDDCRFQVEKSAEYIEQVTGYRPRYFAYPWGQASSYMRFTYMPKYQPEHRFRAAFSIKPGHVSRNDNIWFLPRYVCGRDWRSTRGIERILLKTN